MEQKEVYKSQDYEAIIADNSNEVLYFILRFETEVSDRYPNTWYHNKFLMKFNYFRTKWEMLWLSILGIDTAGFCYHFAMILKTTFKRGKIVWVCPKNHFAFLDDDGILYDYLGAYRYNWIYLIPEDEMDYDKFIRTYLRLPLRDPKSSQLSKDAFGHFDNSYYPTLDEWCDLVKTYCENHNLEYFEEEIRKDIQKYIISKYKY